MSDMNVNEMSREAMARQDYFYRQSEFYKAKQEAKGLSTQYLRGFVEGDDNSKGLVRKVLEQMIVLPGSEIVRAYRIELDKRTS